MLSAKVLLPCLICAVLLFLYTFNLRKTIPSRLPVPVFPRSSLPSSSTPSRLPSRSSPPSLLPSSSPRSLPSPSSMQSFFLHQAGERKSLFETALHRSNPTLVDVFVFMALEAYCPLLVRVGSVGDGGKWVCNPWALPKGGVVFSLGSRNDISFERDLQRITGKKATIITVDRTSVASWTLDGLSSINASFVHAEIAEKTDLTATPPHYTVADLMKRMGHNHIEFLKMDIEGAETTVLPRFLEGNSVCQIMVEIHKFEETLKLLRTIANAGFLLQKYEMNPYGAVQGVSEYSFIHEKCLEKFGASILASYMKG